MKEKTYSIPKIIEKEALLRTAGAYTGISETLDEENKITVTELLIIDHMRVFNEIIVRDKNNILILIDNITHQIEQKYGLRVIANKQIQHHSEKYIVKLLTMKKPQGGE